MVSDLSNRRRAALLDRYTFERVGNSAARAAARRLRSDGSDGSEGRPLLPIPPVVPALPVVAYDLSRSAEPDASKTSSSWYRILPWAWMPVL